MVEIKVYRYRNTRDGAEPILWKMYTGIGWDVFKKSDNEHILKIYDSIKTFFFIFNSNNHFIEIEEDDVESNS
jgi:hypothetical protein